MITAIPRRRGACSPERGHQAKRKKPRGDGSFRKKKPRDLPTLGRRTVLIPKGHGSGEWRLIVNRSARGGGMASCWRQTVFSVTARPNIAEFLSIPVITEAAAILIEGSQRVGNLAIVGCTMDLESYFSCGVCA